jgi:hypothetical protein
MHDNFPKLPQRPVVALGSTNAIGPSIGDRTNIVASAIYEALQSIYAILGYSLALASMAIAAIPSSSRARGE